MTGLHLGRWADRTGVAASVAGPPPSGVGRLEVHSFLWPCPSPRPRGGWGASVLTATPPRHCPASRNTYESGPQAAEIQRGRGVGTLRTCDCHRSPLPVLGEIYFCLRRKNEK